MEITNQISAIKEKIEKDKQKAAILKGREEENLKQLSEYGLKSFSDAEKWLLKTQKDIRKQEDALLEEYNQAVDEMIEAIKKAYKVDSRSEAERRLFGV